MRRFVVGAAVGLFLCTSVWAASGDKLLWGFEDPGELKQWSIGSGKPQLSDQHVTQGKKSLKLTTHDTMDLQGVHNWAGYESLDMDVFVEGDQPVSVPIVIADKEFQGKPSYWNRHNGLVRLRPGKNQVSIALTGLYRGEAGSRNNDLKSNIDPANITRLLLDIGEGDAKVNVYLDNLRLVKASRPAEVLAFDFGPDSQMVFPGFTPIGPNTVYGRNGNKAGLRGEQYGAGAARDATFPTRLYQDAIVMEDTDFIVDVPEGKYKLWVTFENSGYWGGEEAMFEKRIISVNGKEADVEDRGQAGPSDYLFHFENVEPKPGDSMWELYAKYLTEARKFEAPSSEGKLVLRFHSGAAMACKVSAVVIYPANSQAGDAWVKEVEEKNKQEFESRAVFLGPMPRKLSPPATAGQKGYWLGYPSLEDTVSFVDEPGKAEGKLHRVAAQGQRVSMTFAIRPLKDLEGAATLSASDLKGDAGSIPAAQVDLRYVQNGTQREFNSIAYRILPVCLRPVQGAELKLNKDLTRQFWVTVHVPADTKAGTYSGELTLKAGAVEEKLPISVEVLGLKLDEPDYSMGFFSVYVPNGVPLSQAEGYRRLLTILKDSGMNSFTGGPGVEFKGLDAAGKPILEGYQAVDEFFRVAREVGYNKPVASYGGPAMIGGLHDGYVIGQTGRDWAQKTGKSFEELLKLAWSDLKAHAEQNNWLPVYYGLLDEPRVLEAANEHLELFRAYKKAVPFVKIGGFYSVHWEGEDPLVKAIQEIFKTLDWSGLGGYKQIDIDKAKEFNKELWMYNTGLSRFSWGAYQWAMLNHGFRGRIQWHTQALHGYQFFDLDGREPDVSAIMWGKEGMIPTVHLPRCREGADDLRYAVTLWNLAEKNKDQPEAKAAMDWLKQVTSKVAVGNAEPVKGLEGEAFREQCVAHLRKLMK